jgi:hypothetical protein
MKMSERDRQRFARARERGRYELQSGTAAVAARYDEARDAIALAFRNGDAIAIPRSIVRELANVPVSALTTVSMSPAGDAISWRAFDIDIAVRGLAQRAGHRF